jgi:hypothetical protein
LFPFRERDFGTQIKTKSAFQTWVTTMEVMQSIWNLGGQVLATYLNTRLYPGIYIILKPSNRSATPKLIGRGNLPAAIRA